MAGLQGLWQRICHGAVKRPLLLAFCLPFCLFGIVFAAYGAFPFGDRQVLVTDLWHQYYPFLCMLQDKLRHGGSFLYTWTSGLGSNYPALYAYYAASPLNLLMALLPRSVLREGMTLLLMAKVGFAGLFCAAFLKYTFRRRDLSITVFALFYACCGYITGYYWNSIWLDTVALLPLVMLGLVLLVRDRRCMLYPLSLALALLTNYYIAYFICLFSLLAFPALCICYRIRLRQLPVRCLLFAVCALLAGGLSAWLLLPAYEALQLSYSAHNTFPAVSKWLVGWRELAACFLPFHAPTAKEGLPNLYCGLLPVLLMGAYLPAKRIPLREKLCAVGLTAVLLLSCTQNQLNFIWHGFHVTNMLPYRFAFLLPFLLVTVAYRLYARREAWSIFQLIGMVVALLLLCLCGWGQQPVAAVLGSAFLGIGYLVLLALRKLPNGFLQRLSAVWFSCLLLVPVLTESAFQVQLGVDAAGMTARRTYPRNVDAVSVLRERITDADPDFYRMETTPWYSLNDNALYDFHGVSQFSSTANVQTTAFLRKIGLPAWESGNRYYYAATSPFTNLLLDVRYVLAQEGELPDAALYEDADYAAPVRAYRPLQTSSLGFLTNADAADCLLNGSTSFSNQNQLFSAMTGLQGRLFTPVEAGTATAEPADQVSASMDASGCCFFSAPTQTGTLTAAYPLDADGLYYACITGGHLQQVEVCRNAVSESTVLLGTCPYIFPLGSFQAGDQLTLNGELPVGVTGSMTITVCRLDQAFYEAGCAVLTAGAMTDLTVTDTKVSGTVTATQDSLLYTSIPYEAGWTARVDGEKVDTTAFCDALLAVPVTSGTHQVTLSYCPTGFVPGICISIVSALLLLLLFLYSRRRVRRLHTRKGETACET